MDIEVLTLKNFLGESVKVYRDTDNNIIVNGDIHVSPDDRTFDHMPVKIHKLNGDILWHSENCVKNNLKSLINFPDIVNGSVRIFGNPMLKSLKYCPIEINGNFECDRCSITSFDGISQKITGNLIASFNPIVNTAALESLDIKGCISIIDTSILNPNMSVKTSNNNSSIIADYYSEHNGGF